MKILWVIPFTTYKNIPTAGGQLVYHYYDYLKKNTDYKISYIGFSYNDANFELMKDSFKDAVNYSFDKNRNFFDKLLDYVVFNVLSPILKYWDVSYFVTNPAYKNRLRKSLQSCIKDNYQPDVVIAEFTHSAVLIDIIKKYFPKAKCIATAHDLFYINLKRNFQNKFLSSNISNRFRNLELGAFKKYDCTITYNYKDGAILSQNGVNNIFLSPYYHTWVKSRTDVDKDGILFWGALVREENYTGIQWFLTNVWPELSQTNKQLKLYIVGAGLPEHIKAEFESYSNAVVTSYVKSPADYFNRSYAMIVPLFKGAGIKIKVLESMSSYLPVITTPVGAEGINLTSMQDCIIAEKPDEFINAIQLLINDQAFRHKLVENARALTEAKFNIQASYEKFAQLLIEL